MAIKPTKNKTPSPSFPVKRIQLKTTMEWHSIISRRATIIKTDICKYWQGCNITGCFTNYYYKCKIVILL